VDNTGPANAVVTRSTTAKTNSARENVKLRMETLLLVSPTSLVALTTSRPVDSRNAVLAAAVVGTDMVEGHIKVV
jgi:hypothetical protein